MCSLRLAKCVIILTYNSISMTTFEIFFENYEYNNVNRNNET